MVTDEERKVGYDMRKCVRPREIAITCDCCLLTLAIVVCYPNSDPNSNPNDDEDEHWEALDFHVARQIGRTA